MRRLLRCAAVALVLLLAATSAARAAYFAPGAQIVSAAFDRREQADDQTLATVISADGAYVVFQTRARNLYPDADPDPPGQYRVGGIFRTNLATGALELVANGDRRRESDDTVVYRGAQNPSVSADGRYVSFATAEPLVAADTNGNVDVYVRDMAVPAGSTGAFELVSAKDGGATPASYGPPDPDADFPGRNPGADTFRGAAISGDGRYVAFRTSAGVTSDLPDRGGVTTPELQLFVRDRVARTTTLVTRDATTGEPAGGALGAFGLSADGTTIAWSGRNAPAQTRFLLDESPNPLSVHLLWRRWIDGPSTPTRRIAAASDPDDPACPPSQPFIDNPLLSGPCYGPLGSDSAGGILQQLPAMSADGRTVAYLHDSPPRGVSIFSTSLDLFVTSMAPGATRKASTVELTRDSVGLAAVGASLDGVAMSADGRFAVISTNRTTFSLPALRQLTAPRADTATRELYLVDLQDRTIERILQGYRGGDANGAALAAVSVDAQARRIAFVSAASNLMFGDANGQPDAFVVQREDAPPPDTAGTAEPEPVLDELPLPPLDTSAPPARRLSVYVGRSTRFGEARLVVQAPAAGTVRAIVRGRLPDAQGRLRGSSQTLATARVKVKRKGKVTVVLRLGRTRRAALRRVERLTGQADVRFTDRAGRAYARRLTVAFPNTASAAKK